MLFKIKEANNMPPQVIPTWHLISLWKTSLATSQIFGHLARCMKTIYCMVAKDVAKLSLQNCRSILMTNWLFSLLSSLLVFCDTVPSVFKLVDDNDDDGMIPNISKAIHEECKNLVHDKNKYTIRIDKQTGIKSVSATLISLLENMSDNPWFKLPSIVIGNIITSAVTNQPTPLQIGLGVTLGKKSLVQQFHDPGICCSYDELL